jgi:hypothetical protein
MCQDYGVMPQSCLTGNISVFTSCGFQEHQATFSQIILFAGIGDQNGHAKHAIQTVMAIAWIMMLHATINWPDIADSQLWPMAVQHAV